jgi:hypothetical protein
MWVVLPGLSLLAQLIDITRENEICRSTQLIYNLFDKIAIMRVVCVQPTFQQCGLIFRLAGDAGALAQPQNQEALQSVMNAASQVLRGSVQSTSAQLREDPQALQSSALSGHVTQVRSILAKQRNSEMRQNFLSKVLLIDEVMRNSAALRAVITVAGLDELWEVLLPQDVAATSARHVFSETDASALFADLQELYDLGLLQQAISALEGTGNTTNLIHLLQWNLVMEEANHRDSPDLNRRRELVWQLAALCRREESMQGQVPEMLSFVPLESITAVWQDFKRDLDRLEKKIDRNQIKDSQAQVEVIAIDKQINQALAKLADDPRIHPAIYRGRVTKVSAQPTGADVDEALFAGFEDAGLAQPDIVQDEFRIDPVFAEKYGLQALMQRHGVTDRIADKAKRRAEDPLKDARKHYKPNDPYRIFVELGFEVRDQIDRISQKCGLH